MGKPSRIAAFTCSQSGKVSFAAGLMGASKESPKTFFVDFGDGVLREFSSDDALAQSANVSGDLSGQLSIYIPEGEVLTCLDLDGVPLSSVDLSKATELVVFSASGCGLYDIDLKYNRCLQRLDLSGNNLYNLDLQGVYGDYEKNVLAYIDASRNNLSNVNVMSTGAAKVVKLASNKLQGFSLKNYDYLQELDLSDNQIEGEVDMTHLYSAVSVNLSGNRINSIIPCAENAPASFDIRNNEFTYRNLPSAADYGEGYLYAPQKPIVLPAKAPTVDLTAEYVTVEGNPTVFTWKKTDGTPLKEGTDYMFSDGFTRFLSADLGNVYCELTNASFPQAAGENAIRTTDMEVMASPNYVLASFTPTAATSGAELIIAGKERAQVYIDWKGNGAELVGYEVYDQYHVYPVADVINAGAEVKIYGYSDEDARNITVFSLYGMTLGNVDLSRLKGTVGISLGGTGLDPENISLPENPNLAELNLEGNHFTEYPYMEAYPNLSRLVLASNSLTSIDVSPLKSVQDLVLSDNKIEEITFDNPMLWNIQIDKNKLTSIDLSGLPALEQLVVNNNLLTKIDLAPVAGTLRVLSVAGNRFKFSTLPTEAETENLLLFYYGNQAPVEVECVDMKVDLSSEAVANGVETSYSWFVGVPEYDPETGTINGELLEKGTDYEIENGVTTFLKKPAGQVLCVMTNASYENLTLVTDLIDVKDSGVDGIEADADGMVSVYSLQGVLLRRCEASQAFDGLAPGVYIAGGRKIMIKD